MVTSLSSDYAQWAVINQACLLCPLGIISRACLLSHLAKKIMPFANDQLDFMPVTNDQLDIPICLANWRLIFCAYWL